MHLENSGIEQFLTILRGQGCRITPIVMAVINHLFKTSTVNTAQQLRDEISIVLGYQISLPTIYRVLERLLTTGIICSMHKCDGLMRYYLCRKPQHGEHHHFICSQCLKVQEVPVCFASQFTKYIEDNLNATVDAHFIQLEGLCSQCRKE